MTGGLPLSVIATGDAAAERAAEFVAAADGPTGALGATTGAVLLGLALVAVIGTTIALIAAARNVARGRDGLDLLETELARAGEDDA